MILALQRVARWLGVTGGLAAIALALHGLGQGSLALPDLGDGAAFSAWLTASGPVTAAFAIVRAVAWVGAWYLLGITVLRGVGQLCSWHALVRLLDRCTLPSLRRLLGGATVAAVTTMGSLGSAGVAGAGTVDPVPVTAPPADEPASVSDRVAVMRRIDVAVLERLDEVTAPTPSTTTTPPTTTTSPPTTTTTPPSTTATTTVGPTSTSVPKPPPTTTTVPLEPAPLPPAPVAVMRWIEPAPAPAGPTPEVTHTVPADGTWTVDPGESFWSIATEHLADELGRAPGENEIREYWLRLIAANRDRLPDPDNPDLVFIGTTISLPPAT